MSLSPKLGTGSSTQVFGKCLITVNEEIDIIDLKCFMLCPKDIFFFWGYFQDSNLCIDKITTSVLGASNMCSWIHPWPLIVCSNFKSSLLWDRGNS